MYNNKFQFIGRLTKDATIKDASDEKKAVAFIDLAIDKKDDADFVKVSVFGNSVNFVKDYVSKGTLVVVSGRVDFTGKETITTKNGTADIVVPRFIADDINILSKPKSDENKG